MQSDTEASPQALAVLYDGFFTFGFRILNIVCAAALGILTARLLGPAGKGVYALPMVQAALVVSLLAGLSSATSYFLLNRRAGRSIIRPAAICSVLFVLVAAAGVVVVAAIGSKWWAALPALLSLPPSAAINFCSGYVVGVKRVRYVTTISLATTLVTLVFMAAGLLLVARSAQVAIVVWLLGTYVVGFAALFAAIVHALRLPRGTEIGFREYLLFAWKTGIVRLISLLNYRADTYIVAILTSASQLGLYTVAISAAESLLLPTQVAALVTSPHVGSLEDGAASRLTARCVRNNLLVAIVICGVLFPLAPFLLRFFYGSAFEPASTALRILLVGVVALSIGAPLSNYFTLRMGKPEVPMTLAAASAVICIAVAYLTVPHYGLAGAAFGSTLAYVLGQAGGMVLFRRVTRIGYLEMLLPQRADAGVYITLARNLWLNGRRRLLGSPSH